MAWDWVSRWPPPHGEVAGGEYRDGTSSTPYRCPATVDRGWAGTAGECRGRRGDD